MIRRWSATVAVAGIATTLVACGQKGPLYLPDQGGEVVTRPAGAGQTQSPSPETAPQPSTQPPNTTTKPDDEEKR